MGYDYLMWIDNDGNSVPGSATSLDLTSPTLWEATLRQGVKFHDGHPFTTIDVKAAIELASNPKPATGLLLPGQLEVEVVDDYTARIHTPTPFAPLNGADLAANQSGAITFHKDAEQKLDRCHTAVAVAAQFCSEHLPGGTHVAGPGPT
jgi:ABC-type transport system substrate-binding protein